MLCEFLLALSSILFRITCPWHIGINDFISSISFISDLLKKKLYYFNLHSSLFFIIYLFLVLAFSSVLLQITSLWHFGILFSVHFLIKVIYVNRNSLSYILVWWWVNFFGFSSILLQLTFPWHQMGLMVTNSLVKHILEYL